MSNPMQALHDLGLNPFAVTLLAESMLKSAYVQRLGTKPLTFEFPVRRDDCADWAGVRLTIEAVPVAQAAAQAPQPEQAEPPLPEAVEWESLDGLHRTTDKKMAENWAPNVGVRVVRRAVPAEPKQEAKPPLSDWSRREVFEAYFPPPKGVSFSTPDNGYRSELPALFKKMWDVWQLCAALSAFHSKGGK